MRSQLIEGQDARGVREVVGSIEPLTGLGSYQSFLKEVTRLIADRGDAPVPFAVIVLDLDGFMPIRDLFGNTVGDDILRQAAMRLRAAIGDVSIIARVGMDDFAVLQPMISSEEAMAERARMLIEVLCPPYEVGERTVQLSASAGCSLFSSKEETAELLLGKAETSLYHAKRAGRRSVLVYTREMDEAAKRRIRIEQALRQAVAEGEVEPHFQPIVDLPSRRVVGFEALARWTDSELGLVPPCVFIPIAEEIGIIGQLTVLLLRKAAETARDWPQHLFLSFNLTPSQLMDRNTGPQILSTLEKTGFDPKRLEIEITETGLLGDPASAARTIEHLRSMGIRVSLDDFGTGQSSLGRLRDFRFDKLKIDRAFVASLLEDRPSEHIIRAILAMCDGLGIDVIAEGIEEEAQAEKLVSFGCKGGQGFLFGTPSDATATLGHLQAGCL